MYLSRKVPHLITSDPITCKPHSALTT